MKRFTAIDWFNMVFPIVPALVMGYLVSAWWLMLVLAGFLYGSYMWRMLWVMEELREIKAGLDDVAAGRTKPFSEVRAKLKGDV